MVGIVHKVCWGSSSFLLLDAAFTHSLVLGLVGLVTVGMQLVNTILLKRNKEK
jgi:hypothetical protein